MFEDLAHTDLAVLSFHQRFYEALSKMCFKDMKRPTAGESSVLLSGHFMVINNKFELLQPTYNLSYNHTRREMNREMKIRHRT